MHTGETSLLDGVGGINKSSCIAAGLLYFQNELSSGTAQLSPGEATFSTFSEIYIIAATHIRFRWMFYVYIIQFLVDQSFYIGRTSDLANRILLHNSGNFKKGITRLKIPWEYFFILEVPDKKVAIKMDMHPYYILLS